MVSVRKCRTFCRQGRWHESHPRIKKTRAGVLQITNVVAEILGNTIADTVEIANVWYLKPAIRVVDVFHHVAECDEWIKRPCCAYGVLYR